MEKPLVNKEYMLERFPGKGGWTYAAIPEVLQNKNAPFGWVKVKGSIDAYAFKNYRLQPMGNGSLFFPVKAEIRKIIKKEAGDWVHIKLFADNSAFEIPHDIALCLKEEPGALEKFGLLNEGEQKALVEWINTSRKMETKADRIAELLVMLSLGKKVKDYFRSRKI